MKYLKKSKKRNYKVEEELKVSVSNIINQVKEFGDKSIIELNEQFDGCNREKIRLSQAEINQAYRDISPQMLKDLKAAHKNIESFAKRQKESLKAFDNFEVTPGVFLGQRLVPVENVACYVPGGTYPLFSTALMLITPAKVAGVGRIVACSPAVKGTNSIKEETIVAMDLAGADEIYVMGGAQSIAAFTYGTDQIKPVDLIVGPGNSYVTEAKRQCYGKIGIDFVAGPSEVLILAEEFANPKYIAADLLAQSEHDTEAKGILITTSPDLAREVINEVEKQLNNLDTADIARTSWQNNGEVIIVDSIDEGVQLTNDLAPEHLEIHVRDEESVVKKLKNYGSLFIGQYAAEVFGDYASGTNHTLPTMKASRYTGGLSVLNFIKVLTHQYIDERGLKSIGNLTYRLASGEGLSAHANAAGVRLEDD